MPAMWSALAPFHPDQFVSRSTQMLIIIDPVFSPSCSFYLKNSAPIQTGNGVQTVPPLYVSSFWILGQQPSFLSLQRFRILAVHCHPLRTALSSSASRWPEMMRAGSSFAIDGSCGYRSSCQGAASSLPRDHDVAATLCGYVAVTPCLVLARTHGGPYL